MFGGPPPLNNDAIDKLREQKPKSLGEVPSYLKRLIGRFFSRLFYIFGIVWDTRPWILFVMVFMAIFNGVMPIVSAYVGAELLNSLADAYNAFTRAGENLFSSVTLWLVLSFVITFVNAIAGRINGIVTNIAGELVVNNVNVKIMEKAKNVDIASFDRPDFYEKLENASREAGHRPIQILNSNFTIVSTLISIVSFIAVLWAVSPFAPIIITVLSIPSAVINFTYRRKNFMYMRHRSKDRRQMSYYSSLLTDKDMAKELRIFGLSDTFIGRYKKVFSGYFAGLKKLFVNEGMLHILITLVNTAVNCGLFLFIASGVCNGKYQVGDYSLFTGALMSISGGIATFITTTASVYEGTLFIDNMISFMNEKVTVVPSIAAPVKVAHGTGHRIELRNVSFRYPNASYDVIKNMNLVIEPGDTVVLVGLNGAGKTTLIKLLTRLYDPTEGTVLLDGRDIREYDTEDLYRIYGIIFQDFGKYAVNVSENIAFGQIDRETDQELIERAAEQSSADAFIDGLPHGYDTPLMRYFERDGVELSIGQWQKLSIARAFYRESDIVILDEPTASLDAIAEQEIYNQFDSLRHDKTTIFVSHRLSSATVANKIVVLENGRIIEQGNHSELMALGGHYYELFSTQAKRYITDDSSAESSAYDDKSDAGIPGRGTPPDIGMFERGLSPDGKMPDRRAPSDGKTPGRGMPPERANGAPSDTERHDTDLNM